MGYLSHILIDDLREEIDKGELKERWEREREIRRKEREEGERENRIKSQSKSKQTNGIKL